MSLPLLRSSDLVQAREAFDLLDAAGFWLPVLCAGLAVVALIIAPRRRGVLGWLGYGSVVALLATLAGLLLVRDVVLDRAFPEDAELLETVWDVVTRSLFELLGVMLLAALGLLVLRWLTGLRSREAG